MKETLLERLQREVREKFMKKSDCCGTCLAGFYTEKVVDTIIAHVLKEAVGVGV